MTKIDPAHVPVIVGVGQVNDRPSDPFAGLDSLGLMAAAARRADEDAGGGWLPRIDSLAVVDQISFRGLGDVSPALAQQLGANPRFCSKTKYPMGTSPILLLHEAANRIAAGEIQVALVAGGEALRTAAQRAAAQAGGKASDHNAMRAVTQRATPDYRQRYGLAAPVDVYPLYENTTRALWGQTLDEAQRESAEIWARMSEVAAATESAWLRKRVSAEDVLAVSAENRPIAFPYTKLMVANSSVNQGAAFLVASLGAALAHGAAEDRLVYVGRGAAADEPADILKRDRYDRSPSMEISLLRTLELNELAASDLDYAELYSCFPCMPKMARRAIGWPLERPVTVFGGLTFGGGPIGNYMSHAAACMVERLRERGRHGFLFANGGFATQSHSIVLTRDAARALGAPQAFDFQAEADAARGPTPELAPDYEGPATIETYTLFYDRHGAVRSGVVVARNPQNARFLAKVTGDDAETISFLTASANQIGASGKATRAGEDIIWRM